MKKWLLALSLLGVSAFAEEAAAAPVLNSGDTAWMMMSTALVMLMTPIGLAMFYAGMTRAKNVLNTYAMVFGAFVVAFIAWVVAGFSIAFGTAEGPMNQVIGGFGHLMLSGISWTEFASVDLGQLYPKFVFVVFQGTFAAITVAIAAGSVIERMKFSTWMVFAFIWTIVVYAPITHMVWGGGYLFNEGALDFAGGTVVHMNGGLAGLVLALLIGKRAGYPKTAMKPASVILTAIGAGLLWFGWYGFNGGSAFGANAIAGVAYLTTTVAAAVATLTWIIVEYAVFKKPTLLGAATGAIAGLVAITPAAGFVDVSGAFIIGAVGALVAFYGVTVLKKKLGYDDSLDAFGVHFLAGLWGAIATGVFALYTPNGDNALLWAGPLKDAGDRMGQIMVQAESVLIVGLFTLVGTIVVYYVAMALTGGSRVNEEQESQGLDESVHGERGFNL
ncbi:ammonium transporter [Sulfuricurvum sp. IAE1]|jgi:Amt family ammonium transporter|uniref:ammonium transporter n=1 Tax=Sulfuricurvum sp. IAE1 TaxID=2546102 RepID=UPI00104FB05D|nr:ammonium transporter [Sulfuricurvum sp. IAE1]MDX9967219.1 ammonium transporter [Sulfuricurvum sp.]TDA69543.1 ammonium transporter [Sulfuricurvum sp. IAE1]